MLCPGYGMAMIQFKATAGDDILNIEISQAPGGGSSYSVLINNYNQGSVIWNESQHTLHPSKYSLLTMDDIDAIMDLIAEMESRP